MSDRDDIEAVGQWPNIGPKSAAWIVEAGITSLAQLEELGAPYVWQMIKVIRPEVSLVLLYALQGAIDDCHWSEIDGALEAQLRRAVGR